MKNFLAAITRVIARLYAGARLGLAATGFAALLVASPPVQATTTEITINTVLGARFLISANYEDWGADFQINYYGPNDPGLWGNQVDLRDVHFGGGLTSLNGGWNSHVSFGADGSTDYNLNTYSGLARVRGPPFNFSFDYAPENGFAVPAGIGSEALTGWLSMSVWDSHGEFPGFIPAPYSLTHAPMAPVPEPETWALMLTGLGLLGFAARRRKPPAAAI